MEYSKEDLMEAKKQIWGVGEINGSKKANLGSGREHGNRGK